ncbi:TRAP dicarboxylate transporter, DctM subunit [Oleidesulfovibrio alaskensis G20]|uniref:TRAP dicarboxylate transporter, DctM subunit n=1 Tax=Oleidesulfovibrio alaskensis (strain ATCC BAA-1058 / DSM 17464 / G20) TaxID=207559 RepID=Q315F9_OLEA2|nr:TRAP transporter large permease [Oleidesulfovibrio alaskensis]ABB37437.1 TRAP dicarboxylate transporter, DctM subunit [Oleidesulfovibrio alaskensis G20]MBG0774473.1 TRAP transporter large permease [Oleidesulfovibrio alaskensis]
MEPVTLGVLSVGVLLAAILASRIPVGFAMAVTGLGGYAAAMGPAAAWSMLGGEVWEVFSSYGLTVIPFFIFMGQICFYSGVNERLYRAVYAWMGHIRGGIAYATVLACAGFSAICGSNTATAATMSAVALPEMKKYGYAPVLSTGCVAAGATLGVLIPPSVVLIVIGLQTGLSISTLFMAGIMPGLLLTGLFLAVVWLLCRRHPQWGPAGEKSSWRSRMRALPGAGEILILFVLVIGGLFMGVFTPTEAGAAGSAIALLLSLAGRRLSLRGLVDAVNDTLRISSMIMVIILGAVLYGRFLAVTRLPFAVAEWTASLPLPPLGILLLICGVYIVGGMMMDALALLLVTIPIFFPVVQAMGYDPVWFSVFITVITTMGAITPPVGVTAFVVASAAGDVGVQDVFRGVTFFLAAYAVCALLLLLVPQIVLFIPSLM